MRIDVANGSDRNPIPMLFPQINKHTRSAATKNIRTAGNGREAIDYVACRGKFKEPGATYLKPQLILLDLNMPVMSGWGFMQEYSRLDAASKHGIMIVMLTTSDNPDEVERARAIPDISDFKTKPLTAEALEEMVEKYFNRHAKN